MAKKLKTIPILLITTGIIVPIFLGVISLFESPILCHLGYNHLEVCKPAKTVTIEVIVKKVDKSTTLPLSNVKVQFIFSGSPVTKYTDDSGYADAIIPGDQKVKIELSKNGYLTENHNINLKKGGTLPLEYVLKRQKTTELEREKFEGVVQSADELKEEAWKHLKRYKKKGIAHAKSLFVKAAEIAPNDFQIAYSIAWLDHLNYSLKHDSDYIPYEESKCLPAHVRYSKPVELLQKNPPQDTLGKEMVVEIGHMYSNQDLDHKKAIYFYDQYILTDEFDISHPVVYMGLVSRGMANFWLKEYVQAGLDFEKALAQKPSNQVAYNQGSIFAMTGNYDKAIQWYKAAIYGGTVELATQRDKKIQLSGESNLYKARRDLGFAFLLNYKSDETNSEKHKRYEKARKEFEIVKDLARNKDLANIGLGIVEYFEGDIEAAKTSLKNIPQESPYNDTADRYLQKIEGCQLANQKCVHHFQEFYDLSDITIKPILTSRGISRMFGNVTVHEDDSLDPVLALEHASLYKGPCD